MAFVEAVPHAGPRPPTRKRKKGKQAVPSFPAPPPTHQAAATAAPAAMEAEADAAATTNYVYDALPGLTLDFPPEEDLDGDGAEPHPAALAAARQEQDEDDATATYAVFRNEITAAGDALVDIPAADFFSLHVPASVEAEAEAEPASPRTPVPAAAAATPSSSRAAEEQPAQGLESAWFRGGRQFRSPMLQLHKGEGFFSYCFR